MGVDLIPIVRNFFIRHEDGDAHSIQDGCITAGNHKVMRFDFLSHNIGTEDFVVGAPSSHPEWFTESSSHGHYHLKDFNEFILYDVNGAQATKGFKQAFCTIDIEHISPWGPAAAQFTDCNVNQGISAGWADVYHSALPCQFIVIDGVPDGDYTLVSTTNSKHIIPEDTYDNNTICTGLRITGDNVVIIDPPIKINLATPSINFDDVPENETTVRSVTFNVIGCREVHFEIIDGPRRLTGPVATTFGTPVGTSTSVAHSHEPDMRSGYLWISFKGTTDGDVATGQVTVRCTETNQQWTVPIRTNTIRRVSVAVELVLDKSGSMNFNSGFTLPYLDTRIKVLHYAALPLADVIQENNGIGVCAFDHNANPVMPITPAGPLTFGAGRNNAKTAILNHQPNPAGYTAIGDGVIQGMNDLAAPSASGYDVKAMIVLTDGFDTEHLAVSEVTGMLNNSHVFAIGLGNADNIKPAALDALTNSTGGYLLLSGNMNNDDQFLLNKYFLQILAGITNTDIVTDPEGTLYPGDEHIIPFQLNEADITSDIILLTPTPQSVEFLLKAPNGEIIQPAMAGITAGVQYSSGINSAYYRISLPVPVGPGGTGEGEWNAILRMKKDQYNPNHLTHIDRTGKSVKSVRYSLNVYSYSNLKLTARAYQNSYEPGATITIRAVMTQYGLPIEDARVNASIKNPDNTLTNLSLTQVAAGIFENSFKANLPGVYKAHLFANGRTLRGRPFSREQLLTAGVYRGGDTPIVLPPADHTKQPWCEFIKCMIEHKVLSKEFLVRMEEMGVNWKALEKCVCKK